MMLQKNAKTGEVELIKINPPLEDEEFTDVITEPNLEERLEQTEQLLQATTIALTEFIFSQTMGR